MDQIKSNGECPTCVLDAPKRTEDEIKSTAARPKMKVQRTPEGRLLGVCMAIGERDLPFVDSSAEWLVATSRLTENSVVFEIEVLK